MAKWFGKIGFNVGTKETSPSVYTEDIQERQYIGDISSQG